MFLAIDAGNSNIVFGFYDEVENNWIYEFRIETSRELSILKLEKEIRLFFLEKNIRINQISQVGISSVVPEINLILQGFCKNYLQKNCYLINGNSYQKLKVSTARPNEIGSDLMCNVTAAFEKFADTCIIVDFGTALTFTAVGKDGNLLGVNIVPGLKTAIKSLFSNTSKLPEVELKLPKSALGRNTIHSIQSGILYGYTGLVKGMLDTMKNEIAVPCHVIATGGLSTILTTLQDSFEMVDRNLTMEGIRLITMTNISS
ncbi:Pantothenate kinase type III, CoaX-like protein [Indibacter alkaliphilus LW1]|uniref:Type III pantothenate kinase n=1 Tax=Indibacter alkaliphilus (strain CCUG 57479 / KCTC 22604 / LW1) TaxID=1189612 RepID=S2DJN5_INDAL|nr:type III pantothenate kinase [Indibacter alkaliphilus]EOZ92196.1 Pantothenate kinase type III, CoaX-like protein [Indibacter alkaliphilus LW1]